MNVGFWYLIFFAKAIFEDKELSILNILTLQKKRPGNLPGRYIKTD